MKFIEFHSEKCDECFKCLRFCPTKAIAFVGQKRRIIDDLCIKCGICLTHCSHGALKTHQDIIKVKNMLRQSSQVVVSLAPSFAGLFQMKNPRQMATALKQLGFYKVEETARGAELVSRHYETYLKQSRESNILTSCCPSTTYFLEKHYGGALETMIPIVSPMVAHGRDIKSRYGDVKTVFIGPCVAKKAEAEAFEGAIDATITFKELEEWLSAEKIEIDQLDESNFDTPVTGRGKAYPIGGSLWEKDMKHPEQSPYTFIHLDGAEDSEIFLKALVNGEVKGYCAEINVCKGGCINGPEIPKQAPNLYERIAKLKAYAKEKAEGPVVEFSPDLQVKRTFSEQSRHQKPIDEGQVFSVMMEMEKYTEEDQINCGACGYSTCYEKAVAVVQGHSDINHCLDRLKHKVESLQNTIFENSPNAICILNEHQQIQDINPSFRRIFNQHYTKLSGWPIGAIIGSDVFDKLNFPEVTSVSEKIYIESIDRTFFMNLLTIEGGQVSVGIFTDITLAELNRQEMQKVKEQTLDTCQKVIDKQMRVAQEIASLLGETTAETKVGLNQLKRIVMSEKG
jgi:iron only hydrogenase large subunit-like protein/uncharacterized Fe-S cluster-containing protein